jgi:hypothetical protein
MPYESGETPAIGDHVRSVMSGRTGEIFAAVALHQANLKGADMVSVQWDDGGVGFTQLASAFVLVSKRS